MCLPAQAATAAPTAKTSIARLHATGHWLWMPNNSSEQSSFPPKRKRFQGKFVSLSSELLWASPTFSPFVMCCAGAKCNIRSCTEGAIEWRFLGAISTFHDASVPCKASNVSGVMEIRVIWQWKQNSKGSRRKIIRLFFLIHSTGCNSAGASSIHPLISISFYSFLFQNVWYRFSWLLLHAWILWFHANLPFVIQWRRLVA